MIVKHIRVGALVSLAVLALLLVTTTSVFAKTVTFTQTFHHATQTFPTSNPCTGAPGTVTLTFNGVVHVTMDTNTGTGHMTETMTGDFVFVPDDPTQPTITGHFTSWDGENQNIQNFTATATFNLHGTGSDGSRLQGHFLAHISVSATGITILFDKMTCH
jgi:hypothetical protein